MAGTTKAGVIREVQRQLMGLPCRAQAEQITLLKDSQEKTTRSLGELHGKVDKILNIKLNGVTPEADQSCLEASLRSMYEVTRSDRVSRNFWESFRTWRQERWFFKALRKRGWQVAFAVFFIVFVNSLLHALGVELDLISIVKWVITTRGGN